MNKSQQSTKGFGMFAALIAVAIIAIVVVVGFVLLKPKKSSYLPSGLAPYIGATPTPVPEITPVPSLSPSTEDATISKELQDTKVESVDADFSEMNSSATSL